MARFFTNHHTPLISHTSVDILTSRTGVYGDKFGVPIGNNIGLFDQDGVASFPSSFSYWTDGGRGHGRCSISAARMLRRRGSRSPAPAAMSARFRSLISTSRRYQ